MDFRVYQSKANPMIYEDWLKTKKKKNNKSITGGF